LANQAINTCKSGNPAACRGLPIKNRPYTIDQNLGRYFGSICPLAAHLKAKKENENAKAAPFGTSTDSSEAKPKRKRQA
jgi:hypothetical protein